MPDIPAGASEADAVAREQALRPWLTPTFLTALVHATRVAGCQGDIGDICEVERFVEWCHELMGIDCPELYNCWKDPFLQRPPLAPPLDTP